MQNVEISSAEYVTPSGIITSITDVVTGNTDGILTVNGSVLLEGSSLKVGGEDSGIWFIPISETEEMNADISTWIKVESSLIYNMPSKLLFALPQTLAVGKYKIIVRTRFAGKTGYERKYFVEAISETVTVAE